MKTWDCHKMICEFFEFCEFQRWKKTKTVKSKKRIDFAEIRAIMSVQRKRISIGL